jgi:hypothetical protein
MRVLHQHDQCVCCCPYQKRLKNLRDWNRQSVLKFLCVEVLNLLFPPCSRPMRCGVAAAAAAQKGEVHPGFCFEQSGQKHSP